MVIKYLNFRKPWADSKTTYIPDKFLRKHTSLSVIEFSQFLLGLGIVLLSIFKIFAEEGSNIFLYISLLILGFAFIASAAFLAFDNPNYRLASTISMAVLFVFTIILIKKLVIISVLFLILLLVFFFLYFHPQNIKYYLWVKSISE